MKTNLAARRPTGGTDILTLAFGTATAMWGLAYLSRLPSLMLPGFVLGPALLVVLFAGGFLAGRHLGRGARVGIWVGLGVGLINMLVLGSLLSGDRPNQVVPSALWWLPGSLLVSMALAGVGAWFGNRVSVGDATSRSGWLHRYYWVAAGATLFLIMVGGLVTGHRAGLSVVDWPNSYGYNMFLYPLSRMTGGIYYEHAHRLFGSLVGFTTLMVTVQVFRFESRRWVKVLATIALVAVILQGILGGLRVTGRFTLSSDATEVAPNLYLAVVHGVLAQLFFSLLAALAVFTSPTWRHPRQRVDAPLDRRLAVGLLALLLTQLVLGALLRHLGVAPWLHVSMACMVLTLGLVVGFRSWLLHRRQPILRRLGGLLLILLPTQVLLGVASLVVRTIEAPGRVFLTTAHQTTGALLMAVVVATALLAWRLLSPPPTRPSSEAGAAPEASRLVAAR